MWLFASKAAEGQYKNILNILEYNQYMQHNQKQALLVFVVVEKAFASLNWIFLFKIFWGKWILKIILSNE